MEKKFNINCYVKVRLTDVGINELKRQHAALGFDRKFSIKVDSDGFTRFQMWSLMEELGHLCHLGFSQPFETDIKFLSSDLKEI